MLLLVILILSLHSKLAFRKTYLLSAISCSVETCSKHGLLARAFKVLICLPLVILLARHERLVMMKITLETDMRARMLPSQNACRVKADGMGSRFRSRFPLLVMFDVWLSWPYLCKTRPPWSLFV